MLLPSGPANTRCSVCPFEPGGLSCATQPGARNGFAEPRDRQPKSTLSGPQQAAETARHAFEPAKIPANCGLFVRDRETSVRIGLRGGPGRIRTSNQTVMSAVISSEAPMKSDLFRHANQQMFTNGCGQSLANRWLGAVESSPTSPNSYSWIDWRMLECTNTQPKGNFKKVSNRWL
jgi:hypothetical protein